MIIDNPYSRDYGRGPQHAVCVVALESQTPSGYLPPPRYLLLGYIFGGDCPDPVIRHVRSVYIGRFVIRRCLDHSLTHSVCKKFLYVLLYLKPFFRSYYHIFILYFGLLSDYM